MFEFTHFEMARWLISSFLWGVGLGVFYDILRAFKMLCGISYFGEKKTKKRIVRALEYFVTFVCDIVFWIVAGALSILLIYKMGDGIFRGMTYIGMAAGFLLYYFTVGCLVLRFSAFLVKWLKIAVKKLLKILLFPAKKIFYAIFCLYRLTLGRFIGKIIRELKNKKESRRISAEVENLLPEEGGGEEEYVYVGGKRCYRKERRIDFGSRTGT